MAVTNAQRYTAYSRLYHKALKAKDHRNANRYWRLAMKHFDAWEKERATRHQQPRDGAVRRPAATCA